MFIKTLIEEGRTKVVEPVEVSPVLKILKDARALLSNPATWWKGSYAAIQLDVGRGHMADPLNDRAVAWCSLGAVMRAANAYTKDHGGSPAWERDGYVDKAADRLEAALDPGRPPWAASVPTFNDAPTTTHADVLALFDRAIEASSR